MAKRKQTTKRLKVSDQLRELVKSCGVSRYELAKRTGIDESALSRFVHGERGLSMEGMDALGEVLGWEVVQHADNEASKRKGD